MSASERDKAERSQAATKAAAEREASAEAISAVEAFVDEWAERPRNGSEVYRLEFMQNGEPISLPLNTTDLRTLIHLAKKGNA